MRTFHSRMTPLFCSDVNAAILTIRRSLEMAKITAKTSRPVSPPTKRPYLKQSDVPSASLDEALRVPQAILDHYAGRPTTPLQVAKALNMDPKGSQIRVLSGAAMAFGLIDGGAQATSI